MFDRAFNGAKNLFAGRKPATEHVAPNEDLLAFYMGYAFSHAVNVQHVLEQDALMVPYVVYWKGEQPTPVPYPAQTQVEAVENARTARAAISAEMTGWSSGREGAFAQNDGSKLDLLLLEGWVPGLATPLEMFVYYRLAPFRLLKGSRGRTILKREKTHAFL